MPAGRAYESYKICTGQCPGRHTVSYDSGDTAWQGVRVIQDSYGTVSPEAHYWCMPLGTPCGGAYESYTICMTLSPDGTLMVYASLQAMGHRVGAYRMRMVWWMASHTRCVGRRGVGGGGYRVIQDTYGRGIQPSMPPRACRPTPQRHTPTVCRLPAGPYTYRMTPRAIGGYLRIPQSGGVTPAHPKILQGENFPEFSGWIFVVP